MKILVTGGSGFIGTNLTQELFKRGITFCNVDLVPPKVPALAPFWRKCDIMQYDALEAVFKEFKPSAVVHLAAETDTDPAKTLEDYRVNTDGSLHVINACKTIDSIERFVHTSTQFVNQSANGPRHDEDYAPHTVYGESKIISENHLRKSGMNCAWTIIRPTNVWGPWHLRYPFEFWKVLGEGKYVHPGRQPVIRSYGFVGNVVDQILTILNKPVQLVSGKVYYVGDQPINLYDWVNGFSLKQTGKPVRVVPRFVVYSIALVGDFFSLLKIKFPLTTSRFRSMTTNNPAFMGRTFEELGEPRYSLNQGIEQTVNWLKETHPQLVKI